MSSIHVVPREGKWAVIVEGVAEALSMHATQAEAEKSGRAEAKKRKVEFILHGENGRIRLKDSYGNDPRGGG